MDEWFRINQSLEMTCTRHIVWLLRYSNQFGWREGWLRALGLHATHVLGVLKLHKHVQTQPITSTTPCSSDSQPEHDVDLPMLQKIAKAATAMSSFVQPVLSTPATAKDIHTPHHPATRNPERVCSHVTVNELFKVTRPGIHHHGGTNILSLECNHSRWCINGYASQLLSKVYKVNIREDNPASADTHKMQSWW